MTQLQKDIKQISVDFVEWLNMNAVYLGSNKWSFEDGSRWGMVDVDASEAFDMFVHECRIITEVNEK